MNYKRKLKNIIYFSIFLFFVSIFLAKPVTFGLCFASDVSCIKTWQNGVEPLGILSLVLFISAFALTFFPEHFYRAWKRFALVYIPIAGLIVFITSKNGGGFLVPERERVLNFTSSIYIVITALIIVWKSFLLLVYKIKGKFRRGGGEDF